MAVIGYLLGIAAWAASLYLLLSILLHGVFS